MPQNDLALMAHFMRRAGFGADRVQLEQYAAKGYDAVLDDLLHPERFQVHDEDALQRYYSNPKGGIGKDHWIYHMINSEAPLREKMALFWHQVFATGADKVQHPLASQGQIEMFRQNGLSELREILTDLSKDPAMIMWLDNNQNLSDEPNENYGRELLELFSMGVGNYTEEDVKATTGAFTGWSFEVPLIDRKRYGFPSSFLFREEHDDQQKDFLGHAGRFNGEDIIDMIVTQPATARFICRRLYDFFVADEPPVASWNETPPREPEAVDTLVAEYFESGGEIRAVLKVLFSSDFFKEAVFKKVKSPVELVTGVVKLVGTNRFPELGLSKIVRESDAMGQNLLQPLTVEGWHTGPEWIDGGTLNTRVNFASEEVNDPRKPGVRAIVERLASNGGALGPEEFADRCLDLTGPLAVDDETRESLVEYAQSGGDLRFSTESEREESESRIVRMLQLIVSTREFQFN